MSVVAPLKKTTMSKITKKVETELWDKGLRVPTYSPNVEKEETLSHPDARMHQIVSFIKSGIRILGYILIPFSLPWAAGILVASEVVGIIEELV
jgi:predicted metalloenzyme YecM